jgi:3-oxo-5-alpha-steroid 4-dehydrogenase 1
MDRYLFYSIVIGWIFLACITFIILLFVTAPYGRHTTGKWGRTIPNRVGWILMETPALVRSVFILTVKRKNTGFGLLPILHYINRSCSLSGLKRVERGCPCHNYDAVFSIP